MKVPFLDLSGQYKEIKKDFGLAFKEAIKRSDFILGKDVGIFEKDFAGYSNRRFAIGVNSGTDALFLGLKSLAIGPGDEVIVPAFTYIATSLAVTYTGARPVFVDINEDSYNIAVDKIEAAITKNTKAVIPVHLYGHPADMQPILEIASKYNLKVLEDTAQAHGARYKFSDGRWAIVGSMGDIGAFSFYPTKNLGAFGDAGMIVTDDEAVYKKMLMLRDYGRSSRYEHVTLGFNSRLDTVQAAVLRSKLPHLDKWNDSRRKNASRYNRKLKGLGSVITPKELGYARHVYHVYGIRVKERQRVMSELAKNEISTLIHYPMPLHLQEVYKNLNYKKGDFPVAERVAEEVISLPMYPHLKPAQINFICDKLKEATK
ncbi:MAG: DegT/DnrJ/EryC1/StrS family aminotransferase [Candidatus Omnitrophica bacterium]|nr:DegT/DnrJ/EryC1/StrS family aminotransferase [Candidatus Omnitrophota bacterium]